jgi:hypothetical protein
VKTLLYHLFGWMVLSSWCGTSALGQAPPLTTQPSTPVNSGISSIAAPPGARTSPNFLTGLLNLEFSNYHLTARGLNLQDKGLISQPKLLLYWRLYGAQDAKADFNELTLTTGFWNDVDTKESGVRPSNWNEAEPSAGLNFKFLRDWGFESPFTAFMSESHSYPTCWNWNPRLTYHDHFISDFSFNPYLEFFDEMSNKSTVVFNRAEAQSGCYGALGFDPTYVFKDIPLKLELPTYFTICSDKFYQRKDGAGGGTGLGLVSSTFKATVPLEFVPENLGRWSVYAGVGVDYLNNPGLLDGNEALTKSDDRQRSIVQYHGGLTIRF